MHEGVPPPDRGTYPLPIATGGYAWGDLPFCRLLLNGLTARESQSGELEGCFRHRVAARSNLFAFRLAHVES